MLDPLLLRTFLLIAQGNSFSETSRRLSMRQSTVSDHVKRLEQCLGRQLFVRDTHSVALTREGEALVGYAQQILETTERAERHFAGAKLIGRVRFGASEDLVVSWLAPVLKSFLHEHPDVEIELTIALSSALTARFDAGELDVVVCKRWPGEERGRLIWRDEIVWVGPTAQPPDPDMPLQLILYPPSSITRAIALAALSNTGRTWRVACTSDTLSGIVAAAQAGLGIATLARKLVPAGLVALAPSDALPALGMLDFILMRRQGAPREAIAELCAAIATAAAR